MLSLIYIFSTRNGDQLLSTSPIHRNGCEKSGCYEQMYSRNKPHLAQLTTSIGGYRRDTNFGKVVDKAENKYISLFMAGCQFH